MSTIHITKSQLVKLIESAVKKNLAESRVPLREGERHDFIESILSSYLEACAWSSTGEEPGEDIENHEFSEEAMLKASKDVADFVGLCERSLGKDIYQICQDNGQSLDGFGNDLWLTSAGHGAGFWDGDWEMDGDALTELVKKSPLRNNEFEGPYLGDDGLIYFS